jgi:NADPH:quinone reductase-like Zn-dependent oxidoreductase
VRVDEVPDPRPPTGSELLVRVAASSVNGTDLGLARGGVPLGVLSRAPLVLGFDIAGVVEACGPAVTGFVPGDPVIALLGHGGGGQAERVLLPQSRAALAPSSLGPVPAAALPLAGLTALQALRGRAGLHAREHPRVLVVGAAGGIGSFAVQLAKVFGARVTAVGSSDRAGFLRDLGADEVLDRHEPGLYAGDRRWDVVLDAPSVLTAAQARRTVVGDGVVVSTQPLAPGVLRGLAARPLRRGGPRLTAVATRARGHDLALLARLVDDGRLRVPVDRVLDLDDVVEAHRHVAGGAVRGKVVLTVAPG